MSERRHRAAANHPLPQARAYARPLLDADVATLVHGTGLLTGWSECIAEIARSRDKARFAELFSQFAPRLKHFFIRLGAAPGLAEDLAQDTLLIVWHKADHFDPALASASTWIFTIARNLRIDALRRVRDPRLLTEFFIGVAEPLPSEHLLSAEREERVRKALSELPEEQAIIVRLSFFEGRPHGEIARLLDLPLGTVKSRLRLAMNRLRVLVEDAQ